MVHLSPNPFGIPAPVEAPWYEDEDRWLEVRAEDTAERAQRQRDGSWSEVEEEGFRLRWGRTVPSRERRETESRWIRDLPF